MKNYLFILVTFVVALFSTNALAYTPPPAPANGWYVVDQSGKLSDAQQRLLNQKIERISKTTKNEFGILLLSNMDGDNIEDVANATYKAWGVGKRGLDNGCLIVVAIKERKSRIETGKGVGSEVSDLQANDILRKNLNPHLKSGDFYGGFDDTLGALSTLMESRHNQKADPAPVATTPAPVPTQVTTTPRSTGGCQVSGVGEPSTGGTWLVLLLLGVGASVAIFVVRSVKRRQAEEERERQLSAQRRAEKAERIRSEQARLAREQRQRDQREKELQEQREREVRAAAAAAAQPVAVRPSIEPHSVFVPPPPTKRAVPRPKATVHVAQQPLKTSHIKPGPVIPAGAAALAAAESAHETTLQRERLERERREAKAQAEREADERRARQRERDDEDRRRRDREDEDRRRRDSESSSSSSSSSSWDSGSSSGGGFGGGDSGGGGSSSDW